MSTQIWVAPAQTNLTGENALPLQNIFASLSTFISKLNIAAVGVAGPTGPAGSSSTINIGSTTTLTAGSAANVYNSGSAVNAILNFGIPAGIAGANGFSTLNMDGGEPSTIYGGTPLVDAGGI